MSFIRNQLISKTYETVTYGYFIYFVAWFTLDAGSLSLKIMIQNSVDDRSNEVCFTKNKTYKVGWTVRWEIHKALFVFVFCNNPTIENFLEKITDLSFIQRQSSTQVKEDVLGLLGIEGGLFGLVGRWLFFFFVVSRCGVFLPGRIDRFNDDQCVCLS